MNGTHLPYEHAQQGKGAFADQPLDLTFIGNDKGYYKMNKNQPNSYPDIAEKVATAVLT